jgi:hypothetical protein
MVHNESVPRTSSPDHFATSSAAKYDESCFWQGYLSAVWTGSQGFWLGGQEATSLRRRREAPGRKAYLPPLQQRHRRFRVNQVQTAILGCSCSLLDQLDQLHRR